MQYVGITDMGTLECWLKRKVLSRVTHLHFHGSGAWFRLLDGMMGVRHGALLEIVERMELDEVSTETLKNQMTQEQKEWMERTQSEMFSVLSVLTKGEANQLVRSCNDKNGYTAWKKLYDRFNPKTPASLTAAWRDVIRPKKIKDMREAGKAIDSWESKVVELKKEHGEEPTTGRRHCCWRCSQIRCS